MTRREFFSILPATAISAGAAPHPLVVPVQHLVDGKVQWGPQELHRFQSTVWAEAARELESCGIRLETTSKTVEISRPPFRQPVVAGLEPRVINFVITDRIPLEWDNGRALSGVTTLYRGHHLCMIALKRAHGNQVPFLSLNTCLHELLHVLLHDVFEARPKGVAGQARELRVDWYATRLWLFGDGAAIRRSAESYLQRLRKI